VAIANSAITNITPALRQATLSQEGSAPNQLFTLPPYAIYKQLGIKALYRSDLYSYFQLDKTLI